MSGDDEQVPFGELDEMRRTASVADHLLQTFADSLINRAPKVDIGPVRVAAIEMDHVKLVAFVIDVVSEAWFYHPELLGLFIEEMIPSKLILAGQDRAEFDKVARASSFIIAAALAGTLDEDALPEQLGRMGFGPHAVDD